MFVLGAEGRGLRPRVRASCDQEVSIGLGGRVESLNVSTAAAVLLFEAAQAARRWLTRELYILDGDNVAHVRGAGSDYVRVREQLVGDVAGFASESGIDVVLVFDGDGTGPPDRTRARGVTRAARRPTP